jgi:hypothetical protein
MFSYIEKDEEEVSETMRSELPLHEVQHQELQQTKQQKSSKKKNQQRQTPSQETTKPSRPSLLQIQQEEMENKRKLEEQRRQQQQQQQQQQQEQQQQKSLYTVWGVVQTQKVSFREILAQEERVKSSHHNLSKTREVR